MDIIVRPNRQLIAANMGRDEPFAMRGVFDHWPARQKWTFEYFKERYSDVIVSIEYFHPSRRGPGKNGPQSYFDHLEYRDFTLGEYLEGIENKSLGTSYMALHPFARTFPGLTLDLEEMAGTQGFFPKMRGASVDRSLWLGPKGTVTPFHIDAFPNTYFQFYGRKRFVFVSRQQVGPCLYIPSKGLRPMLSPIDFENPDLDRFPNFQKARLFEVILEPGDAVFIPARWGHYVESLDDSISLANFFCTRSHFFKMLLPNMMHRMKKRAKRGWRDLLLLKKDDRPRVAYFRASKSERGMQKK